MNWLMLQKLEHREQRIAFEELLGAAHQQSERVERLEQANRDARSYWHPPRGAREKQPKVAVAPRRVREIAWKTQTRVCRRFRSLDSTGKRRAVVATAIARELSAFIWAINREVVGSRKA